jgi:ferredoxin-NADP reductase
MSTPRRIRCTVEALTDHGGRVYTVDLRPEGLVPAFQPGQFLHLTVEEYDPAGFWPESRVFSIASAPTERQRLRVCYSVQGRYTARMEQVLKVGSEVWIKLPYGEFIIDDSTDTVLLAGGTGISAFTAFLEALRPESPNRVWLAYGAREPRLLLFLDRFLERLGKVPNFHLLLFTESAEASFAQSLTALPRGPQSVLGRISVEQIWSWVPQAAEKTYYLAGPPQMLTALTGQLTARGVAPERVRIDAWQ